MNAKEARAVSGAPGRGWPAYAVYPAGLLLLLLALYWQTVWSMVAIWHRSGTYTHAFLIAPISLWLVWEKRRQLSTARNSAAWLPLPLLVPGGMAWLLAALTDVLVIQQLAVVGMLVVLMWAILGHRNTWVIAFPLAFLFLMVPMGEDLVNPMMDFTAASTVWLIAHSGVPVYQEGLYFHLPSGSWSVIEACSGVRYLIASFTLGLLYAYLSYRSFSRRALFVLLSVLVPVIANTLRAYMIVMLGHHSGMTIATGVDHLVYGWVFFGTVMLVLFWIGSFWREDAVAQQTLPEYRAPGPQPGKGASIAAVSVCAAFLIAIWPAAAHWLEKGAGVDEVPRLEAPVAMGGWQRSLPGPGIWQPVDRGASVTAESLYSLGEKSVNLKLQHFQSQQQGQELVSGRSDQINDKDSDWQIVRQKRGAYLRQDARQDVWELELSRDGRRVLVWYWYRIGKQNITSRYLAKWLQAVERIGSGSQAAAMVVLSVDIDQQADGLEQARATLSEFQKVYGGPVEQALDAVAAESERW